MNQKNEKKVTGDLFGTASRTQLTLNIEQVLLYVEILFSIIMEDITKQKKKKRLGDCYADIRKCVGTVCDELGEIISPHIIEDAGDHIATKPHNIRIPFKLL